LVSPQDFSETPFTVLMVPGAPEALYPGGSYMGYQYLLYEEAEGVAWVTVNREKALNALNPDVLGELKEAFGAISQNQAIRAAVITGAGDKAFVAGADIAAMREMTPEEGTEFATQGHATMDQIQNCRCPVIAAVNGFCLGGGLELALSCDFIYASDKAKLGLPEVNLSLFPGFGGTQRLTQLVGPGRAKEIIFTARMLSADEAADWGIVNKVVPAEELKGTVAKLAKGITTKGPVGVSLAKKVINQSLGQILIPGLKMEKDTFGECFRSEDLKEGLTAFLEKRKADFKGK
jgi:enoyl-CoA hydratase